MKKQHLLLLFLLVFSTLSLVSCDNEPIDSQLNLSDFGDDNDDDNNANAVFKANVEGVVFLSSTTIASYSDTSFGPQLALNAINSVGENMSIQIVNPSVGTFTANTTTPSSLLVFQYNTTLTGGSSYSSLNSSTVTSVGSLTITSLNTTTNKVSGTFSFTAFNTTNSTLQKQVTLGEFTNISFTNTVAPPPVGLAGSYKLTAFNTSVPTDLNGDGTSSTNQLTETTCFNDMFLTLNPNNTFNADAKGIEITINGGGVSELSCFTDPDYSGTWSVAGNILTLTYTEDGTPYTDSYTISGNTLSATVEDGTVVGTSGGNPIELTSDITFVFTKQ